LKHFIIKQTDHPMKLIILCLILFVLPIVIKAQTAPLHPSLISKGTYYGLSKPLRDLPALTKEEFNDLERKLKERGEFNEGLGI
jgi:hypothetical protein